jgi:hypothetical protein
LSGAGFAAARTRSYRAAVLGGGIDNLRRRRLERLYPLAVEATKNQLGASQGAPGG